MNTKPAPVVCSVVDAANRLCVSRGMVYKLIREERLGTVKIGRRTLVKIADLERLTA